MRTESTSARKSLSDIGMMVVAPLLVAFGATAVLALATPSIFAATVIAFALGLLIAGTAVTRNTTAT